MKVSISEVEKTKPSSIGVVGKSLLLIHLQEGGGFGELAGLGCAALFLGFVELFQGFFEVAGQGQ
jgi:hypothetical protein